MSAPPPGLPTVGKNTTKEMAKNAPPLTSPPSIPPKMDIPVPKPPTSVAKDKQTDTNESGDGAKVMRHLSRHGSQKHFSLPSVPVHLLQENFKHLRTASASSLLSVDSSLEVSSYSTALELVQNLIRSATKSGNHVNVGTEDLQLLQKALLEFRRHDDIWLVHEAEEEIQKNAPVDLDLEHDTSFDAVISNFAAKRRHLSMKRHLKARKPTMAIPHDDKMGPLMRFLDNPDLIMDTASKIDAWDFDIFELEKKSNGNALKTVAIAAVTANNLHDIAPIMTLRSCLEEIQKCYRNTPYHNATHGADVCQSLHALMCTGKQFSKRLSHPMRFGAILAAACHDMGHPGRSNAFLSAASAVGKAPLLRLPLMARGPAPLSLATVDTDLAAVYNDQSPLENMHMALMCNIMRSPSCDVFCRVSAAEKSAARKLMIQMVLGTDNAKHGSHIEALQVYRDKGKMVVDDEKGRTPQACLDILPTLLHAADVSNPVKPWNLSKRWTDAIMSEFYAQGDDERRLGLDVTFDKSKIVLPKFQLYFINGFVGPFYKAVDALPDFDCSVMLKNLKDNAARWESMIPKTPEKKSETSSTKEH